MKKVFRTLITACLLIPMYISISCCSDDDKNKTDVTFTWSGSEDLLRVTTPEVTWWTANPTTANGESIKSVLWKKDLHYEDFDSLMVYVIVTYPMPQQLPDTVGKVFHVSHQLSGTCLAYDESGKLITPLSIESDAETEDINGWLLESYLKSLSGIIDKKGFVVYRNGHAREKLRWEELSDR